MWDRASPTDAAVTEQGSHPRVLLAAATTIPAVLVTPLETGGTRRSSESGEDDDAPAVDPEDE